MLSVDIEGHLRRKGYVEIVQVASVEDIVVFDFYLINGKKWVSRNPPDVEEEKEETK